MLKSPSYTVRPVRDPRHAAMKTEKLESRQLLSVSVNSAGWTVVTPSAGSQIIYCSSSQGNDSNSGLSPSSPVQTLNRGESLLRNGTGDELLLQAGDVFYGNFIFWNKSGASGQDPLVLGSYGTGARPEIMTGTRDGLETGEVSAPVVNYLDVLGINFCANGRDPNLTSTPDVYSNPAAISILTQSDGITIQNCEFQYYDINVNFDNYLGPISNVNVSRNIIIDAYSGNTHAQGMYANGVTNLTIEGNLFDQNGYNNQLGIPQTVFNQDCYIAYNCSNCVIEDNIFSRAANTGLEDRPGGLVENNMFIDDPTGMTFGLVNGALTTAGGVTGQVTGNVFTGGGNDPDLPEGQALLIGNTKPGADVLVSGNIFTQGGANGAPALTLTAGKSQIDPQDSVGINDLMISGNVFSQWSTGIDVSSGLTPGGRGISGLNNVSVMNNEFENLTASFENHVAAYASQETISGNSYYNADLWLINDAQVPAKGGTVMTQAFAFPNPSGTVALYDSALGNAGSINDFLTQAANLSAVNWNSAYTASGIVSYYTQAFGLTPVAPPPTSTTPPNSTTPPPVTKTTPPSSIGTSAKSTIKAVSYKAMSKIHPDGFGGIGTVGGSWAEYSNINFGSGVTTFKAEIAALAQFAGSIQIRLDSPTGTLVGTLKIRGTGAWNRYVAQTTSVHGISGLHNLYLVFVGGGGVGNVASLSFT